MLNLKMYLNKKLFNKNIERLSNREGFGQGLLALGKKNKKVVALCADLTDSTKMHFFKKAFPNRFIELGVAEQNLAGVAAGLALSGKIPFMASYAVFSPGRNWDQIRTSICYNNVPVKIVSTHAGLNVGPDGATHQGLEDIAITRCLPNLKVIAPCDYNQAKKCVAEVAKDEGPVYIRLARFGSANFTNVKTPFKIGKADVYYNAGNDLTIISNGPILHEALLAAEELRKNNIKVTVVNLHTIKPLDTKLIINCAKKSKAVLVVEEHQKYGGVFSAVAESLSKNYPVLMDYVAVEDTFGESGEPRELWEKYGLTKKHIIRKAKRLVNKK